MTKRQDDDDDDDDDDDEDDEPSSLSRMIFLYVIQQQGGYTIKTGECEDHLVATFLDEDGNELYQSAITGAFSGTAASNKLSLEFNTCLRYQGFLAEMTDIQVDFHVKGIVGTMTSHLP